MLNCTKEVVANYENLELFIKSESCNLIYKGELLSKQKILSMVNELVDQILNEQQLSVVHFKRGLTKQIQRMEIKRFITRYNLELSRN